MNYLQSLQMSALQFLINYTDNCLKYIIGNHLVKFTNEAQTFLVIFSVSQTAASDLLLLICVSHLWFYQMVSSALLSF